MPLAYLYLTSYVVPWTMQFLLAHSAAMPHYLEEALESGSNLRSLLLSHVACHEALHKAPPKQL